MTIFIRITDDEKKLITINKSDYMASGFIFYKLKTNSYFAAPIICDLHDSHSQPVIHPNILDSFLQFGQLMLIKWPSLALDSEFILHSLTGASGQSQHIFLIFI